MKINSKNCILTILLFLFFLLFFTFCYLGTNQEYFDTSISTDPLKYDITNPKTDPLKYDITNTNIQQYHKTEEQIRREEDTPQNFIDIFDNSGNPIKFPMEKSQNQPTYFQPGTYPYGSSNYVPLYSDSILLSNYNSRRLSNTITPLTDTPDMLKGFCNQEKNNPMKIEETCMKMNKDQCASTQCCVLLGGSKCVAGNEQGPLNNTQYSDPLIQNREYYYYMSKCYGHC